MEDVGPDVIVQELFFEDYAVPALVPDADDLEEEPVIEESAGLVRRVAKSALLGVLMLGSLVFAGLALLGGRRKRSRLATLRRRFIH